MAEFHCNALSSLFEQFSDYQAIKQYRYQLSQVLVTARQTESVETIIQIYTESFQYLNKYVCDVENFSEERLCLLQEAYRELEKIISLNINDNRYSFVIVIPVADRPKHLEACLASLLTLCQKFEYGSLDKGRYQKIQVIIADDSQDEQCIKQHECIKTKYNKLGISTQHFTLNQQLSLMEALPDDIRRGLNEVLGDLPVDSSPGNYSHKGASIMRNISYLKLVAQATDKTLFYFIDSDQEFNVKVNMSGEDRNLYLLNYFYELDRIFSNKNITMLTGKVVGDPPVSPAVMASNFLDDVLAYFEQLSEIEPEQACGFHPVNKQQVSDASYHDMAEMFGFHNKDKAYAYPCSVADKHTNSQSFSVFCSEVNRFFYGEHPTRKMYFEFEDALKSVSPARTVYTGNYIFSAEGLRFFIPFASLKLRMAGPVLGRIVKSELSSRFVTANLPMLHKRTYEQTGVSEFRAGINDTENLIDLSGEYERQYFGDVMLFAVEEIYTDLIVANNDDMHVSPARIMSVLQSVEAKVNEMYMSKRSLVMDKVNRLSAIFIDKRYWWNDGEKYQNERHYVSRFINNIRHNFSEHSTGVCLVNNQEHKQARLSKMCNAIIRYGKDRKTWAELLNQSGLSI